MQSRDSDLFDVQTQQSQRMVTQCQFCGGKLLAQSNIDDARRCYADGDDAVARIVEAVDRERAIHRHAQNRDARDDSGDEQSGHRQTASGGETSA